MITQNCNLRSLFKAFECRHIKSYPAGDRFLSYNLRHTTVNMVIIELYKPRATHRENKEFSKSKTTKLFYITRDSRLIFLS